MSSVPNISIYHFTHTSSWQYFFLSGYPLQTVLHQQVLKQIIKEKPHQILFFPFTFTVNVKLKLVKPLPNEHLDDS
jgi:hypothetical protein